MADLYNLLEELEETEESLSYDNNKQDPRRLTVETAATEGLSDGDDNDDDDNDNDYGALNPEVPAALMDRGDGNSSDADFGDGFGYNDGTDLDPVSKDHRYNEPRRQNQNHHGEDEDLPNELYEKLHRCWLQEKHCPELLDYDERTVGELLRAFGDRREQTDDLSDRPGLSPVDLLVADLARQDLDRARFVLSDWLTHRLRKIESHPLHMRTRTASMSPAEIEYLVAYGELVHHHLEETVTNAVPPAWGRLDAEGMIDAPDREGYHFWSVREAIVDADEIDHEEGSCLVARYLDMREHMRNGKVELLV